MKIVRTAHYSRGLKRLGAAPKDIETMERSIVANPGAGDVIPGLGGVRKLRFGIGNRGKRGGGRAIYFLIISDDVVLMLDAYGKNDKEDLTAADKRILLAIVKEFTND